MNLYDAFAINMRDAEEGKWFELIPGVKFKIRRFKSKKNRQVRERLELPYRQSGRNLEIPADVAEDMLREQLAEAIIADWEGVTDGPDGAVIPYSKEAALALLKTLPELADEIATLCTNIDNYRDKRNEDIVKN